MRGGIIIKHRKWELDEFLYALTTFQLFFHGQDDDVVWEKVVEEAVPFHAQMHTPFFNELKRKPFISSERPDIIFTNDTFILGIECFDFDSTAKTRKGSQQALMEKKADRRINERYRAGAKAIDGVIYLEEQVNVSFSLENYARTLIQNFRDHKKNIKIYRDALNDVDPGKKIYLAFYINDATALGNYILNNGRREAMNPLLLKEFIDELSVTNGLDYVLTNTQEDFIRHIDIQQINERFISALYSERYDFTRVQFAPYSYKKEAHIFDLTDDETTE